MVNILVPTDFSDLSKVAINYAIKVANKFDGRVTLLHVISGIVPVRGDMSVRIKKVEMELVAQAELDFAPIIKDAQKLNKTDNLIINKIEKGESFGKVLKAFVKKNKFDLIVMGTRGASGVSKYVLGSNTVSVLEESPIPVLAVPGNAEFKTFKNVVYATDLKHFEREVRGMLPYLKIFDSTLHVFHVVEKLKDAENLEVIVKKVLKKVDYRKSTVKIDKSKKIEPAIESFVQALKADLVIMFTHKRNFYEKLFNRSMTKEMAFQTNIPLLAFKSK
ncbi:MAG TPA: universal stress protein [Cyclobacteriaceae bacterium]|nr:universal stress protein [Cyclobacteriaceae bacterium]